MARWCEVGGLGSVLDLLLQDDPDVFLDEEAEFVGNFLAFGGGEDRFFGLGLVVSGDLLGGLFGVGGFFGGGLFLSGKVLLFLGESGGKVGSGGEVGEATLGLGEVAALMLFPVGFDFLVGGGDVFFVGFEVEGKGGEGELLAVGDEAFFGGGLIAEDAGSEDVGELVEGNQVSHEVVEVVDGEAESFEALVGEFLVALVIKDAVATGEDVFALVEVDFVFGGVEAVFFLSALEVGAVDEVALEGLFGIAGFQGAEEAGDVAVGGEGAVLDRFLEDAPSETNLLVGFLEILVGVGFVVGFDDGGAAAGATASGITLEKDEANEDEDQNHDEEACVFSDVFEHVAAECLAVRGAGCKAVS